MLLNFRKEEGWGEEERKGKKREGRGKKRKKKKEKRCWMHATNFFITFHFLTYCCQNWQGFYIYNIFSVYAKVRKYYRLCLGAVFFFVILRRAILKRFLFILRVFIAQLRPTKKNCFTFIPSAPTPFHFQSPRLSQELTCA